MVDVDGVYLHVYRKQQSLIQACVKVSSLNIPAPSLSSWEVINEIRNLFIVVWVNGINVTGVTVDERLQPLSTWRACSALG